MRTRQQHQPTNSPVLLPSWSRRLFGAFFIIILNVLKCSMSYAFQGNKNQILIKTTTPIILSISKQQQRYKQPQNQYLLSISSCINPISKATTTTTLCAQSNHVKNFKTMVQLRPFGKKQTNTDDDTIRKYQNSSTIEDSDNKKQQSESRTNVASAVRGGKLQLLMKRFVLAIVGGSGLIVTNAKVANAAVTSIAVAAAASSAASAAYPTAAAGITTNNVTLFVACIFILNIIGSTSVSFMTTCMQCFSSWYMLHLTLSPLITKAITAGVIGIMGDYMAQYLEYIIKQKKQIQKESINNNHNRNNNNNSKQQQWKSSSSSSRSSLSLYHTIRQTLSIHGNYHSRRGLSILADGILISGPLMHLGYNLFESIIPVGGTTAVASSFAALTHVLADSILLDSIFIASTFIMTGIFEGCNIRTELIPQFRIDYIPSLKASWYTSLALLPIEFICFRYLPLNFRVLAVNFIDVIWDAVISFMAHRNRNNNNKTNNANNIMNNNNNKHDEQQQQSKLTSIVQIDEMQQQQSYTTNNNILTTHSIETTTTKSNEMMMNCDHDNNNIRISNSLNNNVLHYNNNHIVPDAETILMKYPII